MKLTVTLNEDDIQDIIRAEEIAQKTGESVDDSYSCAIPEWLLCLFKAVTPQLCKSRRIPWKAILAKHGKKPAPQFTYEA